MLASQGENLVSLIAKVLSQPKDRSFRPQIIRPRPLCLGFRANPEVSPAFAKHFDNRPLDGILQVVSGVGRDHMTVTAQKRLDIAGMEMLTEDIDRISTKQLGVVRGQEFVPHVFERHRSRKAALGPKHAYHFAVGRHFSARRLAPYLLRYRSYRFKESPAIRLALMQEQTESLFSIEHNQPSAAADRIGIQSEPSERIENTGRIFWVRNEKKTIAIPKTVREKPRNIPG
jgi:hypothetical protein